MSFINVKVARKLDLLVSRDEMVKKLKSILKPDEESFCSNQGIRHVLKDLGITVESNQELSKYLKTYAKPRIMVIEGKTYRGWLVKYQKP